MTSALLLLDVFIPGAPKSKGSLTAQGKRMVENVAGSKRWRMLMADQLRRSWNIGVLNGHQHAVLHDPDNPGVRMPLTGAAQVDAYFYLPVEFAEALTIKGARGNYDLDKLERNLYDALTDAGVWRDDSQAVDGRVAKLMAIPESPQGVRVLVWRLS